MELFCGIFESINFCYRILYFGSEWTLKIHCPEILGFRKVRQQVLRL